MGSRVKTSLVSITPMQLLVAILFVPIMFVPINFGTKKLVVVYLSFGLQTSQTFSVVTQPLAVMLAFGLSLILQMNSILIILYREIL